ncbi:MAG TPA: site-specific DNA-methyltransferase [Edaphocola sp.]|nr:site-specific DNA-methyltransferase [Edaphocola sp.]
MEKLEKLSSENIVAQNLATLKQLFPTIVKEGKLNVEELQAILGDYIEEEEEYYRFTWAGKSQARQEANKPSTATLRPNKTDSKDWDTTGNIFIEGDNLEVLKLLQKSYSNKIKMIYIDPPYNTGKDFVYKDNYKDNLSNYLELTGQIDSEGNKTSTNTESDGRYHSNWLNMMYPRLQLARNLLTDDGAIFISIGVEEFPNLKKLCDEIFGEENFIEIFSWVKTSTPPALSIKSRKTNEYIICYEKFKNSNKYNGESLDGGSQPLLNRGNSLRKLIFPKESILFNTSNFEDGILLPQKNDRVNLLNEIILKNGKSDVDVELEGEFKWIQNTLLEEVEKGTTFIINTKQFSIRFIRDEEGFKRPTNFIKERIYSPLINKKINGVETNESASKILIDLMKGNYFDYPKPVSLIKYLIKLIDNNNIILDFFAGSGTTAHAVMQLNAEDGGNRKCISVQLPEATDENSEAFKAGFTNIAEITKERIRRAGEKIKQDFKDKEDIDQLDIGFRAFKLDSSNIRAWDSTPEQLEGELDFYAAHPNEYIKPDRTTEDILFEILIKFGLNLTVPILERKINNQTIYNIDFGKLFICLADAITPEIAEEIGNWKQELNIETTRVIFKDSSFATDADKTNCVQILNQLGIKEVNSI